MKVETQGDMDHYRADGVRITHDPFHPDMAAKYGKPGETDSEVSVMMVTMMMMIMMFVPRVLTPMLTAWAPASMAAWSRGTPRVRLSSGSSTRVTNMTMISRLEVISSYNKRSQP